MAEKKNWFKRLLSKSETEEPLQEAEPEIKSIVEEEPRNLRDFLPSETLETKIPSESEAPEQVMAAEEEEPVSDTKIKPAPEPIPAPEEERPEKKKGLFARLKQQLSKTKDGLVEKVRQVITLHGKVDDEMLEDIEMILIQADVGIETTTKIIDRMRRDSAARKAESPEDLIDVFKQALLDIVSNDERVLALRPQKPTVMMFIGVNGVGKTTTIGKIAREYSNQGKKVMLVAGDTFRAAAVEQLNIWAERTGSTFVSQKMGSDPASVCYEALAQPNACDHDLILIDTAGRLHTKTNLMEELKKMNRVIKKVLPDAPHETLLILDATTGQNALNQTQVFSESVDITGLIMTKLDGTAKGGILVALRHLFDIPVLKIGIGEGEDDLRDFDPEAFISALFGA